MSTVYEKPVLTVVDPERFGAVKAAVERSFSTARIAEFFRSLQRAGIRVRNFEAVLSQGLLGAGIREQYAQLGNGDQAQIRELYLTSLEKVSPEIREEFFRLYAYY
ncbi:MAG: hypothetical protein KGK08_13235 [Acidobacteriota bacterium]|nr:hypothetical protein [Acidobacteriota bacterium]